jgi:hypothetical protein
VVKNFIIETETKNDGVSLESVGDLAHSRALGIQRIGYFGR